MVEKGRTNSASATHTLERIADIIAFFSKDYTDTEGRKVEIYSAIVDTLNKIDVEKRWTWKYLSNVESKHIKPGKRFAATIDVLWRMIQEEPIYVSVPACTKCGQGHYVEFCTEEYDVKQVKPHASSKVRQRTPPIRIGEATEEELAAIKQYLTTDERREALVEAANNKRRS